MRARRAIRTVERGARGVSVRVATIDQQQLFLKPGFDPAFRVGVMYNFGNGIDGGTLGFKLGYRIDYCFGVGGGGGESGTTDKLGLHGFGFGAPWKFGYK